MYFSIRFTTRRFNTSKLDHWACDLWLPTLLVSEQFHMIPTGPKDVNTFCYHYVFISVRIKEPPVGNVNYYTHLFLSLSWPAVVLFSRLKITDEEIRKLKLLCNSFCSYFRSDN